MRDKIRMYFNWSSAMVGMENGTASLACIHFPGLS